MRSLEPFNSQVLFPKPPTSLATSLGYNHIKSYQRLSSSQTILSIEMVDLMLDFVTNRRVDSRSAPSRLAQMT